MTVQTCRRPGASQCWISCVWCSGRVCATYIPAKAYVKPNPLNAAAITQKRFKNPPRLPFTAPYGGGGKHTKPGLGCSVQHPRVLGITYKSAWFLTHRIRECIREGALAPFGSNGGTVEVDETFIGKKSEKPKGARGFALKNAMLTLVDRDTKRAKSIVVDDIK